ncbi:cell number regulator 6-like [Mangifera indica]|uniref:cell number regulator 6-like n=1 Tax=Mangifera indica TaxID=29780 RepID=UPI001CFB6861|nr:cell number regulator 6-like [Mangifera indica]
MASKTSFFSFVFVFTILFTSSCIQLGAAMRPLHEKPLLQNYFPGLALSALKLGKPPQIVGSPCTFITGGSVDFFRTSRVKIPHGHILGVLFGHNVKNLREDTPWTQPCICHAICVEGGIALATATAIFHGIDPKTSFLICKGLFFACWMCGIYTGFVRQSLQKKYQMQNSPRGPCMVHCCMHWCALCQEHREMKSRLSENMAMPMTIVNPPPVQDMNSARENQDPASTSGNNTTNLEMQAL